MLTKQKIIEEVENQFTNSIRDREARRLTEQNLIIEKRGPWFYCRLFDSAVRIHVNKRYISNQIHELICLSYVREKAKKNVKESFRADTMQ